MESSSSFEFLWYSSFVSIGFSSLFFPSYLRLWIASKRPFSDQTKSYSSYQPPTTASKERTRKTTKMEGLRSERSPSRKKKLSLSQKFRPQANLLNQFPITERRIRSGELIKGQPAHQAAIISNYMALLPFAKFYSLESRSVLLQWLLEKKINAHFFVGTVGEGGGGGAAVAGGSVPRVSL